MSIEQSRCDFPMTPCLLLSPMIGDRKRCRCRSAGQRPKWNTPGFAMIAATGAVVWSHPDGGSSPAVAGGMVFTLGKGTVYAFGGAADEEMIL